MKISVTQTVYNELVVAEVDTLDHNGQDDPMRIKLARQISDSVKKGNKYELTLTDDTLEYLVDAMEYILSRMSGSSHYSPSAKRAMRNFNEQLYLLVRN